MLGLALKQFKLLSVILAAIMFLFVLCYVRMVFPLNHRVIYRAAIRQEEVITEILDHTSILDIYETTAADQKERDNYGYECHDSTGE